MKIVSAFSDPRELPALARAGASEVYCAVKGLGAFGREGELGSMAGLREAALAARRLGLGLSVAVNHIYLGWDRPGADRLIDLLKRSDSLGVKAFIVSNLALPLLLKERGVRLSAEFHLSSVQPCFNSKAALFFLERGFSRIILPGQLPPGEAAGLISLLRARGAGAEVFDYRFFGCPFVNGRCQMHTPIFHSFEEGSDGRALCTINPSGSGRMEPRGLPAAGPARARALRAAARAGARFAGGSSPRLNNAAAFYAFYRMGAGWLKYGMRGAPTREKVRAVERMKEMIILASAVSARSGTAGGPVFARLMAAQGRAK